jgi:dUTP pyrophosphatase
MEDLIVKIKKTNPEAVLPKYAHLTDAGLDLTAASMDITDEYIEYDTGVAVAIPKGYVGLVFPRSSVSKYDLTQCNSVGIIDAGYRNSIKVRFKRANRTNPEYRLTEDDLKIYYPGDRVAQFMILPYPMVGWNEVTDLEDTDRGLGGFGSTGI